MIDLYVRHHATRRFAEGNSRDLPVTWGRKPVICQCGARTTLLGAYYAEHTEYLGFTRCPYSGRSEKEAAEMDKSMTDVYLLPGEGGYGDGEALWN